MASLRDWSSSFIVDVQVGGGDADNVKLPVDKMFDVDVKQEQEQGGLHLNGTMQNGLEEKAFR